MTGFAGFDRSDYPGAAAMAWLLAHTNLRWCGFYLAPSPSHQALSWMKAPPEAFEGWGRAAIYVGQETTGPGSHKVTAAQGTIDGQDAAALMTEANAPFEDGSCIWLDLENGMPLTTAQREYVAAWCDAVTAEGYAPGVYCSFQMAALIAQLRPGVRIWVFHVPTVQQHRVAGSTFPSPDPSTSGFAGASVWQRDDEAVIACSVAPGGVLTVDLNSANSADPSAP